MAEPNQTTLPGVAPSAPAGPSVGEVAKAAATVACDDPHVADLLRRKAAGQKLTPQEYGAIGAYRARICGGGGRPPVNRPVAGSAPRPEPVPIRPGAMPVRPAPVATPLPATPVQSPVADPRLPLTPGDADFVARTIGAVLTRADSAGKRFLASTAREVASAASKLGVEVKTDRFDTAKVVSEDDRRLLMETGPMVCEAFGVNPRHVPIATFIGVSGMCACDFWLAVSELREIKADLIERMDRMEASKRNSQISQTKTGEPVTAK